MVAFHEIEGRSPSLGNTANISAAFQKTVKKYTLLNHAQRLLTDANIVSKRSGNPHRTRLCHAHKAYGQDAITIKLSKSDVHKSEAAYGGLQTCGSVWACPVCAARVAVEKGQEVLKALEWAKRENLAPAMIALTARHHAGMSLEFFEGLFSDAWRMFNNHRRWKKFKKKYGIVHHIANREITRGDSGWHYHMHLLLFLSFDALKSSDETSLQDDLETLWIKCLEAHGLEGLPEIALKVSAHKNVGETYLTKIGITISEKDGKLEYEMTGTGNKESRNIWDILRHSYYGDEESSRLYLEYVQVMTGKNFITLSHGLADLIADIELAAADDDSQEKNFAWAEISGYWWEVVRRAGGMGKLLEQAASSRDIAHCRTVLWAMQDELIEAGVLPSYHRQFRFRVKYSDDFVEGIRRIE